MKKTLVIIISAMLLCSCAAEKQLARLLQKHPELQYVDTTYVHDTIVLPQETSTIDVSLSDLIAMDSIANATSDTTAQATDSLLPTVSVATDRSEAAILAKGNGIFGVTSTAEKDTIIRTDTIYQPRYITQYKDREVPVYKQKWWQEICTSIGIITLVLLILVAVPIIITKSLRR